MKKKIIDFLPYLAVVCIIALPWFLRSGYLFFTDFVSGPNFLVGDWWTGFFYTNVLLKAMSFILGADLVQKLFLVAVLLITLIAGKKISEQFISQKYLVFALSLFFLFNPFVYDRLLYGQVGVVLALAFLGLAVGNLLQYILNMGSEASLKKNKIISRPLIKSAIFIGLSVMYSLQFIFFSAVFLILFALMIIIKHQLNKKFLLNSLIALVIIIAINFNVFVGLLGNFSGINTFIQSGIGQKDLVAFQTSGHMGYDAAINVFMMSGFWGKDQHRYIDLADLSHNWGRSFFLLLILIIYGVYLGFKSKDKKIKILTGGLLVILAVSIILAIGIRTGVSRVVTLWLFDHLWFYRGLRETQKWVAVEVIIYLIFLSWGVRALFAKKFIIKYGWIAGTFLCGVIIMQAPSLIWGFNGQASATKYPVDWYQANKLISANGSCDGKILFLPWHMYMSFGWIGNIANNPAPAFFNCPVIVGTDMEWGGIYDNNQTFTTKAVDAWLINYGDTDLLADKSIDIRYIIVAKELDWKKYLWLDSQPRLELIQNSLTLRVYRVK